MSIKKIITGLALSLLLGNGQAVAIDGNELLAGCQAAVNQMDGGSIEDPSFSSGLAFGECLGILMGVRTTMIMYEVAGDLPQDNYLRSCFPETGISNGQAARIVTSYLKRNPAALHEDGTHLAVFAFLDAYPCK